MQDNKGNRVLEIFDNRYDNKLLEFSVNLRADDFDEVFSATGKSPHYTVISGWETALKRWLIFDSSDKIVGVIGLKPYDQYSNICAPWMLGTDGLNDISKFFLKISKPIIKEMLLYCDVLLNYVDSRYEKAIRWLKWCGFTVDAEKIKFFNDKNVPFYTFYMGAV